MSESLPTSFGPGDIRRALTILMPSIEPYWERSLRDYAAAAYQVGPKPDISATRTRAMRLLQVVVERAALKAGFDRDDAISAGVQLALAPVLQTGPHCLLLYEPDAFYTHLFSLLGLQSKRRRWHITYAGSTMSFKESAKKGPGWLRLEGEPLNLFGLPRSRMDGHSICCFGGRYRFELSSSTGGTAANDTARRLLAELPVSVFPSAAEAIQVANRSLWISHFGGLADLVQIDDFDAADLIADHLDDPQSWLSGFVSAEQGTALVPKEIERLNAGPWAGWIRRTTDFFWYVGRERVSPLRLNNGYLHCAGLADVMVEFSPDAIASAIRDRKLLPNLFMAFLVLSILPGTRALGGCRQPVYLPLLRHLAAICIDRSGDGDLLDALAQDDYPGMWGHRVLRPDFGEPFPDVETVGVSQLLEAYGTVPLIEASGDLASFTSDRIWAEMCGHLASGVIQRWSAEWKWSGV